MSLSMVELTRGQSSRDPLTGDSRPMLRTPSPSLRWLRPVAGLALLVLVLSIVVREGIKLDWGAAWHNVTHANLALLALAALVFAAAAPLRALRWRYLLGATHRAL